jgi:decaprenylphospho-beta-D-erythro-pentofuranosid-2-ulose 2-reductase
VKKILIIGASSAIAEAAARIWAQRGDQLFLVARNEERLNTLAADLRIRGAAQAIGFAMDANELERHASMLDAAYAGLGGLDTVLIAHGTLSNQKACEASVELMVSEVKTNAVSVMALLTLIANRFEAQRSGRIGIISSVAGDRGRASNYVYGSAKAMVTAFTSGLRQRLHRSNVSVTTIKPGFVDTPMTAALKKGALWAKPDTVAAQIVKAMDDGKSEVYVPGFWRWIMTIIVLIPNQIFKKIQL